MKNKNELVLNDISTITLLNEFTVEIKIQKDKEYELEDAVRTTKSVEQIADGRKLFYLTVFGERTVPTKEARNYCSSGPGIQYKRAEAIVIHSLSQKMVFNFMINVERPPVRTKLFTDIDEAKKWLLSLNV